MSVPHDDELLQRARSRIGVTLSNKYRIEGVLGVGGMASVYAAGHRNGRRVAIKVLHPELSIRTDIRQRFVRESQAANSVKHPGVVAVIDDDVAEDGSAFLVMELLAGCSVEELWEENRQRLPAKTVMAIARDLCDVLDAAHRADVVHRDIKPANLFVTDDGHLKVLDFGIARVRHLASTQLTDTGMLLGTPAFMAPEQASGRTSQIDERTDVWGVGATMFVLLSGRPVHEGETAQHVAMLAATQQARSLATVARELPRELVRLVDRALMLDKTDRWPSAGAMRDAIAEASFALYGERVLPIQRVSSTLPACKIPPSTSSSAMTVEAPDSGIELLRHPKTTSRPVSSDAPTKPRPQGAWNPVLRTLASGFERFRIVVGRTTGGKPVSSMAPTVPRPALENASPARGRSRHILTLAFALAATLLVAMCAVLRQPVGTVPVVGGPNVGSRATPSARPTPAPTAAPVPAKPESPSVDEATKETVPAPAPSAGPTGAPTTKTAPQHPPNRGAPPQRKPAVPATPPKPDCSTLKTTEGKWKRECL